MPYWDRLGAVGYYDHGNLSMARTLGSNDPNQVAVAGRRVLIGALPNPLPSATDPVRLAVYAQIERGVKRHISSGIC